MNIGAEPKKIVLLVVLLVVAVGGWWFFSRTPSVLPDALLFACVETGQKHWVSRNDAPSVLPAKNPRTGKFSLLPAEERDGKLYLIERYADAMKSMSEVSKHVDPETLEVRKN
jgi:hypothetical protein